MSDPTPDPRRPRPLALARDALIAFVVVTLVWRFLISGNWTAAVLCGVVLATVLTVTSLSRDRDAAARGQAGDDGGTG
jgi:hypothetical protein